jgi:predicted ATPase
LTELARHYRRSDNVDKAIVYLGRAGQQAVLRSDYSDAIASFRPAIDLLQSLPDSRERIRREILIQLLIGPVFLIVNGWASPEVEGAFARAVQLCEQTDDNRNLFFSLGGLCGMHMVRGGRASYEIAERLLRLAESQHDAER